MCKFNNHFFTFAILINVLLSGTVQSASLGEYFELVPENDHVTIYDQRENGSTNYRLTIDGVFIALHSELGEKALSLVNFPSILSGMGQNSHGLTGEVEEDEDEDPLPDFELESDHTTTKDNLLTDNNVPTKTDASDSDSKSW
jgi:hypothetical protein